MQEKKRTSNEERGKKETSAESGRGGREERIGWDRIELLKEGGEGGGGRHTVAGNVKGRKPKAPATGEGKAKKRI